MGELEVRDQALQSQVMEVIAAGNIHMPLLPEVAMQLLQMTTANRDNADAFAEVVHRDPILAGHVLEVVNSATFARKMPIRSLKQAVTLLGVTFLGDVAIAASLGRNVFRTPGYDALIAKIWRHSLGSAVYAREINKIGDFTPNGVYLAGLMHGIGRPLALKAFSDACTALRYRPDPQIMERLVDHVYPPLGEKIAQQWHLPDWVVACVAHHRDPSSADAFQTEVRLTALAAQFSHHMIDPEAVTQEDLLRDPNVESLGMSRDQIDKLFADGERISQIVDALKM